MSEQKAKMNFLIDEVKCVKLNSAKSNSHAPIDKLHHKPAVIIGTFLKTKELSQLHRTDKKFKADLQASMDDKIKVYDLIYKIFNGPNCKGVKEWLENNKTSSGNSFPLIQTHCHEEYLSRKQKKMIIKRTWYDISPLKAAAISCDNFLVRTLLSFVPDHQKHQAGLQLQKARNSKEYLESFLTLQKAYKAFIEQYPKLSAENNWEQLSDLEHQIVLCQISLPTYGLQEYCDNKPFFPIPDFDKEPMRFCHHCDGNSIDFDSIGTLGLDVGNGALYKSTAEIGGRICWTGILSLEEAVHDLAAISYLCDKRSLELDSIIKSLLNPKLGADEAQIESEKTISQKMKK